MNNTFIYAVYNEEMKLVRTFILKKSSRRFNIKNQYRIYYKGFWIFDTHTTHSQKQSILKKVA